MPEDKIAALAAAVDKIVVAYRNMLALPADAELHGVELAAGKGVFKNGPVAARLEILEAVAKLPAELGLDVYFRGVDKARLSSRYSDPYHPHDISLMFMIESIEARAKRLASSDGHCRVLLVADEIKDRSGVIVRDVSSYQQTGTAWRVRAAEAGLCAGFCPGGPSRLAGDRVGCRETASIGVAQRAGSESPSDSALAAVGYSGSAAPAIIAASPRYGLRSLQTSRFLSCAKTRHR